MEHLPLGQRWYTMQMRTGREHPGIMSPMADYKLHSTAPGTGKDKTVAPKETPLSCLTQTVSGLMSKLTALQLLQTLKRTHARNTHTHPRTHARARTHTTACTHTQLSFSVGWVILDYFWPLQESMNLKYIF